MSGNPLEAMALIGIGFRIISMAPSRVGAVRAMTRSLDAGALAAYLDTQLDLPDHSLRLKLRAYARDRGVVLEDV
jgi:phosphotransferase system enzyme I (PtsP)